MSKRLPMTGAYAPEATCKHGAHPYDCREGCDPHEHARYDCLWLALEWCLTHGVKVVSWNSTGYRDQSGDKGSDIMPPPELHAALARARSGALAKSAPQRATPQTGVKE